jgi:hypothetical protein
VWGLLADADRLRVFGALALAPGTADDLGTRLDLPVRTVLACLTKLEAGDAVRLVGDVWSVDVASLRRHAAADAPEAYTEEGLAPRAAAVLRAFLRDGRLVSIPSVRSKRLVVLDHVCKVFEPGERYAEREVDALLRAFHDDHAALRRHLVDEAFLSRENGVYWRSGGTVDLTGRGGRPSG